MPALTLLKKGLTELKLKEKVSLTCLQRGATDQISGLLEASSQNREVHPQKDFTKWYH